LALRGAEVVDVAAGLELGCGVADQVVELGQVQGVAAGMELAGAGEAGRSGVDEVDVPGRLALVFAAGVLFGVEPGDGVGHQPVDGHRTAAGVGEADVDPPGRFKGQGVGVFGDPAGPPRGNLQGLDPGPQP
jgi:hypothetical protein